MPSVPNTGEAYSFTVSLLSATTGQILTSPTIATGDVQISTDDGAYANASSVSVSPAASGIVKVDLTIAEVGAEHFTVRFLDQAGAEWKQLMYHETVGPAAATSSSSGVSIGVLVGVVDDSEAITGTIKE